MVAYSVLKVPHHGTKKYTCIVTCTGLGGLDALAL